MFTSTTNEIPYLPFDESINFQTAEKDCVTFAHENKSQESTCDYERGRAVFCESQSIYFFLFYNSN